jgi:hypothetical protein
MSIEVTPTKLYIYPVLIAGGSVEYVFDLWRYELRVETRQFSDRYSRQ